jgi:glutamyl-Q tRNA(Asp) synthetase
MRPVVTRFAPSPTGYLHLGHVYSARMGFDAARAAGGRFLLRIDDIDQQRCRPEFADAIEEDMRWLGLHWDGPIYVESAHLDAYQAALDVLTRRGFAYPCFCSRKEIREEIARMGAAPHGPDGPLYPGTCRNLAPDERAHRIAEGEAYSTRLDVAKAMAATGRLTWHDRAAGQQVAQPEIMGDVMIGRKDAPAGYHVAVVADDADQQITLVTRGMDLFASTHVHRLLQALLDLPVPDYWHHKLITDPQGDRLAKRADAMAVRTLREAGHTAAEVWAMAGLPPIEPVD